MSVEINNKTKAKINLSLVKKIARKFLKKHKKEKKDLSVAFVGDKKIKELNKNYRKIDKVTDVLAFAGEEKFLGEVIIDYNQVKRQARQFRGRGMRAVEEELVFILAHGLLHLLGYDDGTEEGRREMERLGNKFLKNF